MKILTKREKIIVFIGISFIVLYLFMKYIGSNLEQNRLNTMDKIESLELLASDKTTYLNSLKDSKIKDEIERLKKDISHKVSNTLYLKGILNGRAFINSKWYEVGQSVSSCKVLDVNIKSVSLLCGEYKTLLNLHSKNNYIKISQE